jgi:hypothetical protein
MAEGGKRELGGLEGVSAPAAKKYKPEARLGDDRVAAMPVGSNLIEVDGKSCTHEVCWPPGVQGSSEPPAARPGAPAREYPFKLDPFQQTAINALETGEMGAGCSWQLLLLAKKLQWASANGVGIQDKAYACYWAWQQLSSVDESTARRAADTTETQQPVRPVKTHVWVL